MLIDPRDRKIRYVGFTKQQLGFRLMHHCIASTQKDTPTYRWLRKLLRQDLIPRIKAVEHNVRGIVKGTGLPGIEGTGWRF